MEKIILVFYIATQDLCPEDEMVYIERVRKRLGKLGDEVLYFIVPSNENKVECINPKLLTGDEYANIKKTLDKAVDDYEKTIVAIQSISRTK